MGLSALFAGSPIVITMAVALDVGKVVTVSFVYKNWEKISWVMKTYMTIATIVLMIITSAGVFGYLSGEFQKAIAGNNQQNVLITALQDEQARLQKRKEQIDNQIAEIPANYTAAQRNRMMNQFRTEQRQVTTRLSEIDKQLPELKVQNIGQSVKIGPILYVAEAFNTTPEQAVKWVILIIIFVFDPLAVALLIAANFLIMHRRKGEPALPPALQSFSNHEEETEATTEITVKKSEPIVEEVSVVEQQVAVQPVVAVEEVTVTEIKAEDVKAEDVKVEQPQVKKRKPRVKKEKVFQPAREEEKLEIQPVVVEAVSPVVIKDAEPVEEKKPEPIVLQKSKLEDINAERADVVSDLDHKNFNRQIAAKYSRDTDR